MTVSCSLLEINMVMLYDSPITLSICDLNIKHYSSSSSWQSSSSIKKCRAHRVLIGGEELKVVKFVYLFKRVCLSLAFQFRQAEARAKERKSKRERERERISPPFITLSPTIGMPRSWVHDSEGRLPRPHLHAL